MSTSVNYVHIYLTDFIWYKNDKRSSKRGLALKKELKIHHKAASTLELSLRT